MREKAWDPDNPDYCDTFWGSHGCRLTPGHDGPCECGISDYDEDGNETPLPADGCCAPPYFGPDTQFFSNHDTPTPPQTVAAAVGSAP